MRCQIPIPFVESVKLVQDIVHDDLAWLYAGEFFKGRLEAGCRDRRLVLTGALQKDIAIIWVDHLRTVVPDGSWQWSDGLSEILSCSSALESSAQMAGDESYQSPSLVLRQSDGSARMSAAAPFTGRSSGEGFIDASWMPILHLSGTEARSVAGQLMGWTSNVVWPRLSAAQGHITLSDEDLMETPTPSCEFSLSDQCDLDFALRCHPIIWQPKLISCLQEYDLTISPWFGSIASAVRLRSAMLALRLNASCVLVTTAEVEKYPSPRDPQPRDAVSFFGSGAEPLTTPFAAPVLPFSWDSEPKQTRTPPLEPTPATRITLWTTRFDRDREPVEWLKALYEDRCQVCGHVVVTPANERRSQVHHLHPLGEQGPDSIINMLVLCPTHHLEFDIGALAIDPETKMLVASSDTHPFNGKPLLLHALHQLHRECLEHAHSRQRRLVSRIETTAT